MRGSCWLGVLGLVLIGAATAAAHDQPFETYGHPTLEAINQAYTRGEISEEQALLYRLYFVKDPDRIPAELRFEGEPLRCGTGILMEVYDRYDQDPTGTLREVGDYRYRPGGLPETITTTHFIVHYTTIGGDACSASYAQSVSQACETAWTAYHSTYTWDIVPGDGAMGGGMNLIDCYIHSLGSGILGMAEPESPVPSTPESFDYTGFFHVGNTIGAIGTRLCTTAHEYMHVVQFGYANLVTYRWFMENCAMIGEEYAYDQYNDYVGYLGSFFMYPYRSLYTFNGSYEYGQIVWPMYMTERHEPELVELIYDHVMWSANIWNALIDTFASYGMTLEESYMEFMRWCWYTRLRDDGNHFEEAGTWYNMLIGDWTYYTYPTGEIHPYSGMWPESFGTSIKQFNPQVGSTDNMLVIDFNGHDCTIGVDFLCKVNGVSVYYEYYMELDANGDGHLEIPDWDTMQYGMTMAHMNRTCGAPKDYIMFVDTTEGTSAVPEAGPVVRVWPNRPNPFEHHTMIAYALGQAGDAEIQIVDASGRLVRDLFSGRQHAGNFEIAWDGRDNTGSLVGNGVYYARVAAGGEQTVRELTVVR